MFDTLEFVMCTGKNDCSDQTCEGMSHSEIAIWALVLPSQTSVPSSWCLLKMPKRNLQGGYKQQLDQLQAKQGQPGQSHLVSELISLWSWGQLTAPTVQRLASAAFKDVLAHPDVEKLSKIGGAGKFPGNMQRDMLSFTNQFATLLTSASQIPVRLKVKAGVSEERNLTFLLPHKIFAALYHTLRSSFLASVLGGDEANIGRFWSTMKKHPVVTARPQLQHRPDLHKVVPIAIHGDGVAYMQTRGPGSKTMDVLSWSSLLSRGPTKISSFLIFLIVKTVIKNQGVSQTWPRVWKIRVWSLQALVEGVWPQRD